MLSQGARYAVSAVVVLAKASPKAPLSAGELGKRISAPGAYLSQTLSKMIPAGILKSRRGLGGGVTLAKDPAKITLLDVVTTIDGNSLFQDCILGISGCGSRHECPLHNEWAAIRNRITEWMRQTTFKDIAQGASSDWLREYFQIEIEK